MWIAKFSHKHSDCVIGSRTSKFNCIAYEYLVNYYRKGSTYYFTNMNIITGSEKNKLRFLADVKREKRIHRLEIDGDFVLVSYKEGLDKSFYEKIFNPVIFYLKPIIIDENGWEHYEIACWDKQPLMDFMAASKAHFKFKFGSIEQTHKKEFFVPHAFPKLTEKQKQALGLAVEEGYYEYPRHIELEMLGKIMHISRPTFQQHLRTAEKKIIPFLYKSIVK